MFILRSGGLGFCRKLWLKFPITYRSWSYLWLYLCIWKYYLVNSARDGDKKVCFFSRHHKNSHAEKPSCKYMKWMKREIYKWIIDKVINGRIKNFIHKTEEAIIWMISGFRFYGQGHTGFSSIHSFLGGGGCNIFKSNLIEKISNCLKYLLKFIS